jgi:hypothetical protein
MIAQPRQIGAVASFSNGPTTISMKHSSAAVRSEEFPSRTPGPNSLEASSRLQFRHRSTTSLYTAPIFGPNRILLISISSD